ncbi:patatin-like phospholipase family protein [Sphingomonas sp. RT2P30]|uniref:patatin-like phospholipase family protein n=1 Tax=Parasphingomonas halimpatiens TaxID=3096162 RepID=UPI002FC58152
MADQLIAIILQGGGALGAYQAGVFENLAAHEIVPDWIIGTSIGAIIAGNEPERRVERLTAFWQSMAPAPSWLDAWGPRGWAGVFNPFAPLLASISKNQAIISAMTQGIDGFFQPRPGASLDPAAPVPLNQAGFYDTVPLRRTLLKHVDFDYLNDGPVRLSVCAVDIETAEFHVFDTTDKSHGRIGPEHIMASGALPPAFPPILIDSRAYWDGGIYSNTPLEVLLNEGRNRDALVFMVDLWDPTELLPSSMSGVMDRMKSIQYTGRTTAQIQVRRRIEDLQKAIRLLSEAVPAALRDDPEIAKLAAKGTDRTVNVVRLIMEAIEGDDQFRDVDFTRATVNARWAAGKADIARALRHKAWLKPVPPHAGLVIHELEQR